MNCLVKQMTYLGEIGEENPWFYVGQSLTKKVKVDQKSQRLTKNSQQVDYTDKW